MNALDPILPGWIPSINGWSVSQLDQNCFCHIPCFVVKFPKSSFGASKPLGRYPILLAPGLLLRRKRHVSKHLRWLRIFKTYHKKLFKGGWTSIYHPFTIHLPSIFVLIHGRASWSTAVVWIPPDSAHCRLAVKCAGLPQGSALTKLERKLERSTVHKGII